MKKSLVFIFSMVIFSNLFYSTDSLAAVLLNEKFNTENLNNWAIVDQTNNEGPSNWSVHPTYKSLRQTSNIWGRSMPDIQWGNTMGAGTPKEDEDDLTILREGTFMKWIGPGSGSWNDYVFKARVKSVDNDGIGVMFRIEDNNNYYKFEMDRHLPESTFKKLIKVVDGVETVLISAYGGYVQNQWHDIEINVIGEAITIKVDNKDVFGKIIDHSRPAGTVALYCWGNNDCRFDDVYVTDNLPALACVSPNVQGKGIAPDQINLTWTEINQPKVVGYDIYRNGSYIATTPTNYYEDKEGLAPGQNYSYQVNIKTPTPNSCTGSTTVVSTNLAGVYEPIKFIVIPDPQKFTENDESSNNKGVRYIFKDQIDWIIANRYSKNIAYVFFQGDLTDNNVPSHWENFTGATFKLDKYKIPYVIVPGNHDIGKNGKAMSRNSDYLNAYLPLKRYLPWTTFSGHYNPQEVDNTYHKFSAGGLNWLVFSLEFGPRQAVIDWAKSTALLNPNHNIVFLSHAHVCLDNHYQSYTHCPTHAPAANHYGIAPDAHNGDQVFDQLVKEVPNSLLVFNGHTYDETSGAGEGLVEGVTASGQTVYQLLADYQNMPFSNSGYLRIVTIDKNAQSIRVKTYSPNKNKYLTDSGNDFSFTGVSFIP